VPIILKHQTEAHTGTTNGQARAGSACDQRAHSDVQVGLTGVAGTGVTVLRWWGSQRQRLLRA